MLCTATDVGIYGLLASQSCYHSMLAPCWFTLWTSSRFLYPYILLISLEIFLFSCLCPFFFFSEFQIFGAVRIRQDNVSICFHHCLLLLIIVFNF